MTKTTVHYQDLNYQVEYTWGNKSIHAMEFVVYQTAGMLINNDGSLTPDEGNDEGPELHGFLKWDGCINVLHEEGYTHYCGNKATKKISVLYDRIYEQARSIGYKV